MQSYFDRGTARPGQAARYLPVSDMTEEAGQPGASIVYSPLYSQESTLVLPGLVGTTSGASSLPVDGSEASTSGVGQAESPNSAPSRKLLDSHSDGSAHHVLEVDADSLLVPGVSYDAARPPERRSPYGSRCGVCARGVLAR